MALGEGRSRGGDRSLTLEVPRTKPQRAALVNSIRARSQSGALRGNHHRSASANSVLDHCAKKTDHTFKTFTARIEPTLLRVRCQPTRHQTRTKARKGGGSKVVQTAGPVASPSHRCEVVRVSRQCLSGLTIALSPASATTPPTACFPPPFRYRCVTLLSALYFSSTPRSPFFDKPHLSPSSPAFPRPLPVLPPSVTFSCAFSFVICGFMHPVVPAQT